MHISLINSNNHCNDVCSRAIQRERRIRGARVRGGCREETGVVAERLAWSLERMGRGATAAHTEIRLSSLPLVTTASAPSQQDWPSCSLPRPGILPACDKMLLSIAK